MADEAQNIEDDLGQELADAGITDEALQEVTGEAPAPVETLSDDENGARNLDLILDIPLRVTVELGRTKMVVSELLNLGQGSVVELSKLAGEPMEVLVNDKLVARGEAVVVNEKFGVRLTDIISPTERVEQLK